MNSRQLPVDSRQWILTRPKAAPAFNWLLATVCWSLLFTACRPPEPKVVVVREYVTVPAPEPEIPPRPVLPSSQLADAPSLAEVVKALLADRERLAAWALDLETRLKAYLQPTTEQTKKEDAWASKGN